MNVKEAKNTAMLVAQTATEVCQSHKDTCTALCDTKQGAINNRSLWKEGNKSKLIQIGIALIVFPEPTPVSEIVGVGFLAAGAIQKGVKNQYTYMEDIPKSLNSALKEICSFRF
jgi:hypothetical protein